ncbi:GDP-mannose 4,6-dehydratase [Candidatus Amesbacteria bacterium RIFCSPLOWO2_01_FULL_49_25]|uniref:GDP-mannose 4,6-dehydratase n=1 Tax=Candidatus Amesbacteria bacterium RIFCSPHIGHO2_01_FULL_48_32b TaxID=1797253 RepID=A0A1F4YEG4_9BACT|nr:MAG: GDP-mannose 4,6-dehydratase [Candidatus Amesbacteria bacterium RIFCSPHIGHO2_01_FULL_48_32b]OGD08100.1 MAG: GDP-mannose 4,6-dehydratase [Candidatus Amesbacteria bacterium RIFCSPLOWO2_01_FULL_49_25]
MPKQKKDHKKTLITGITGFAGSHLAELLLKEGYEVYGIVRWRSRSEHIEHLNGRIHLVEADLLDLRSIQDVMMFIRPTYIFHLAGQSYVPASWTSPSATLETNVIGSCNLFEAVRTAQIDPVIQIACSSEEYGLVLPHETPIKETNPLRPLSPYAVSKAAMDFMGYQYFKSYGLKIVRTRGFNHEGPRRGDVFVASNFAKQIALIEKKLQSSRIMVGNLNAQRDFTDVRDMVRGYYLSVLKCTPGDVYNISSDKAWVIKNVLDKLLEYSRVQKIKIVADQSRIRPSDVPLLVGDSSKFRSKTGWKPRIKFEQTLLDTLNYWRARV